MVVRGQEAARGGEEAQQASCRLCEELCGWKRTPPPPAEQAV